MEWINKSRILIVGLGLMGGSYARALKRIGYHVDAIDKSEASVKYAVKNGIIDGGATTPDKDLISKADTIIFALYPAIIRTRFACPFRCGPLSSRRWRGYGEVNLNTVAWH